MAWYDSYLDEAKDYASSWWEEEKTDITDDAKEKAKDSVMDFFGSNDEKSASASVKQDAAAQPNATQQTVSNAGGDSKGLNWTAISAGVGLLGIAAKFMK